MSRKIYPACVARYYAPEELRSMSVWDQHCEKVPLTKSEIAECEKRDLLFLALENRGKRHDKPRTKEQNQIIYAKHKDYYTEYRDRNRERINERQRAYDAAHKAQKRAYALAHIEERRKQDRERKARKRKIGKTV